MKQIPLDLSIDTDGAHFPSVRSLQQERVGEKSLQEVQKSAQSRATAMVNTDIYLDYVAVRYAQ